jgi:WD40 repeat protein
MFNHNGSQLASLGRDRSVRVWDATDGHRLFALGGTNRPVTAVAFNPSAPQLAVAFSDGAAGVWDTGAWQKQWEFRFATGNVEGLAYPSDGKRLALRGPNELAICDATSGALVRRHRSEAPVTAISFVSGGNQLLVRTEREAFLLDTGQASGMAVLPDPDFRSGGSEERRHLPQVQSAALSRDAATTEFAPAANARSAAKPLPLPPISDGSLFISPTADRFVTISSKGVVRLWTNTTTSVELGQIRGAQPSAVHRVFFSRDGRWSCTGGDSGTAKVWDADTGKELMSIPSRVYGAAFSPDGKRLVTTGTDRIGRVWDLEGRTELLQLRGHSSAIDSAAFSPDGSRLATIALDGTVKLWSAGPGREVMRSQFCVWGLSVSPDGQRIASSFSAEGSEAEEFALWDAEGGQRRMTVNTRGQPIVGSAFSPDGRRVVTVGGDGLGRVWDANTGRFLFYLEGHTRNITSVAYARSGRTIATASRDGTARIWDADTGRQLHCLDHGSNLVSHVAFSPDSRRLATAGVQGLKLWEVSSGRLLLHRPSEGSSLWRAVFSPDGRHLLLIDTVEPVVRVCDARSGQVVATWPTGVAGAGAFSGDGRRCVVTISGYDFVGGMSEASAQLWDVESGRRILTLKGHSELYNQIAFAPNDRRIVSSSFDFTVRQWESFPQREAEYPGTPREPLLGRVRRLADEYWQQRLAAEARKPDLVYSRSDKTALWPKRDPRATAAQLDLTDHYNYLLQVASMPEFTDDGQDNYLRELGKGLLELGGVRLDVRGVIQLRRHSDAEGAWRLCWEILPVSVEDIRVQQTVRRLHVLHGTACTEDSQQEGAEVARFVWHYETGQEASPILYGQDVRDWWWRPENANESTSTRSRVVWTGSNPYAREKGYSLRLYLTTIENPRPQELVRSLDYVSAMSESAPFLIALTVE